MAKYREGDSSWGRFLREAEEDRSRLKEGDFPLGCANCLRLPVYRWVERMLVRIIDMLLQCILIDSGRAQADWRETWISKSLTLEYVQALELLRRGCVYVNACNRETLPSSL